MGRFPAAARVAAFFIFAMCRSPLARACEDCDAIDAAADRPGIEMPDFEYSYAWRLTYRDEGSERLAQTTRSERFFSTDVALDDSWVFGLRFELAYGWKR